MHSDTRSIKYIREQPRWDVRYFEKKYIEAEQRLANGRYPLEPLSDHSSAIVNFGAYSLCNLLVWVDDGIPYIRVTDIDEYGINWSKVPRIPVDIHRQLPKSIVQPGDVLYSMAGTIGLATVAPQHLEECNSNQALAKIRLSSNRLSPEYLAVFLNSRLGRLQSERIANGQTVLNINLGEIGQLRVPTPPRPVQDRIAEAMQEAYVARLRILGEADRLYSQIDSYLLHELGISLTKLQSERSTTKSIRDIIGGRFDFEAVVTLPNLKQSFGDTITLKTVCKQINERITPVEDNPDDNINYIGLGDIAPNTGELVDFAPVRGSEILSSSPKFQRGDILVGKMRPYLNKVWLAEFDGVCSGEAIVLRPDTEKVDPIFLHALLLSHVTLDQVVPLQSGTSLPRVSAGDVLGVNLPIPSDTERQAAIGLEISRRRAEARRLRAEAERVVAEAKAKVERMILGEEAAV